MKKMRLKQKGSAIALLLAFLWGCSFTNNSSGENKLSFKAYISSLDTIRLPLRHNPEATKLPSPSKSYDIAGFKHYKHAWADYPLGVYYSTGKVAGLIDCSIGDGVALCLTTYDLQGNKVDSLNFYQRSANDMGYHAIEYLVLKPEGVAVVLDTVKRWSINKEGTDIVEGSMKLNTGKAVYRILENGKIERKYTLLSP